MLLRLVYLSVTNVFSLLRLLAASDRDKEVEILVLLHQVAVLQRQLGTEPSTEEEAPDRYRYDPTEPTPALGGPLFSYREAGPKDNRPLEARSRPGRW